MEQHSHRRAISSVSSTSPTARVASPSRLRSAAARSRPLRWLPLCLLIALSLISLFCEPADLRGGTQRPATTVRPG
jgi:hypothetical protein